jgi:hypothetical protein
MANFALSPGVLNISATHGDDFLFNLDFDVNLTGYSFDAEVVTIATNVLVPMTVTAVDLAEGQLTIGLHRATLALLEEATHHWYFEWTISDTVRRVLAGEFIVSDGY